MKHIGGYLIFFIVNVYIEFVYILVYIKYGVHVYMSSVLKCLVLKVQTL